MNASHKTVLNEIQRLLVQTKLPILAINMACMGLIFAVIKNVSINNSHTARDWDGV